MGRKSANSFKKQIKLLKIQKKQSTKIQKQLSKIWNKNTRTISLCHLWAALIRMTKGNNSNSHWVTNTSAVVLLSNKISLALISISFKHLTITTTTTTTQMGSTSLDRCSSSSHKNSINSLTRIATYLDNCLITPSLILGFYRMDWISHMLLASYFLLLKPP